MYRYGIVQIKVTPERLEQVAKTVKNVRYTLEQIHNGLYNQTEHIAANWAGATSQHFYQMFNEAKPKLFTVLTEFDKIADELERVAKKFRMADAEYDGNLVESEIIANTPSSENNNTSPGASSSKKDGESLEKVTRDLVGELSGEYDVRRVIEGVDPDTGEKLSWWERTGAGVMVFAGLTPLGKGIKVVKGAKKVADAVKNIDKVKEAKALLKAKRQKQIEINKKVGDDFEREMLQTFKNEGSTEKVYTKQVTLQTASGVRTRVDIASKNLETSEVHLTELKSSLTAPLTKNQKLAFPEIEKHGAIIKSRNKPPFDYLEVIPPTKVKVIRKEWGAVYVALHDTDKIDLVSMDNNNEDIVYLTIFDALDWEDEEEHALLLQDKINTYLTFIENGEIYDTVPELTKKNKFVVRVIAKHELNEYGTQFYDLVRDQLHGAGYGLQFNHRTPNNK